MTVVYEIVQHDGGWAYRVKDVYSETFPTHELAAAAAHKAAERQHQEGLTAAISYQDRESQWHTELADGRDRPDTRVVDNTNSASSDAGVSPASANSPARPDQM